MIEIEVFVLFLSLVVFSLISYWKKALDKHGILAANIVGLLIFWFGKDSFSTGLIPFFLIVLFFAIAESCTRYARMLKKTHHEIRSVGNILGNSGAALIALVFASPIGFFAAVACALADTLSSEVGLLSKVKPRLITTFRHVAPGIDGAISSLGTTAAAFGALLIGAIYFLLFNDLKAFAIISFAGFFGMLADSMFGATLQKIGVLNNSTVNFVACGVAAIAAVLLFGL